MDTCPTAALSCNILSVATCHKPLCHIHLFARVCATLLSCLRRLSFSSRNSIKQTRTKKKKTEKNFKMFVTFRNFFCEFPRNAVSPALYEREFSRVNFAKNNSSFSSFCLSLVSSLIFQLNTFALHFLSAIYLSFGLKFFWALFL